MASKAAKKVKKRGIPAGSLAIYLHKLEDGPGPEWEYKGSFSDIDKLEDWLPNQSFGLKRRQEIEILAHSAKGVEVVGKYDSPNSLGIEPVARWLMYRNNDNEIVVQRMGE